VPAGGVGVDRTRSRYAATDAARPDGAQPTRSSERVPHGPVDPDPSGRHAFAAERYARGRGKTNFCKAASLGQTATGFWPRIWIMVGIALALSPTSLKTTGPPYCMSPPE